MTPSWMRPTTERKIVAGFRNAIAILFALIAAGSGVLILVLTKAGTTAAIIAGVGLIVLALWIAIPANMKTAQAEVLTAYRAYKKPIDP